MIQNMLSVGIKSITINFFKTNTTRQCFNPDNCSFKEIKSEMKIKQYIINSNMDQKVVDIIMSAIHKV